MCSIGGAIAGVGLGLDLLGKRKQAKAQQAQLRGRAESNRRIAEHLEGSIPIALSRALEQERRAGSARARAGQVAKQAELLGPGDAKQLTKELYGVINNTATFEDSFDKIAALNTAAGTNAAIAEKRIRDRVDKEVGAFAVKAAESGVKFDSKSVKILQQSKVIEGGLDALLSRREYAARAEDAAYSVEQLYNLGIDLDYGAEDLRRQAESLGVEIENLKTDATYTAKSASAIGTANTLSTLGSIASFGYKTYNLLST